MIHEPPSGKRAPRNEMVDELLAAGQKHGGTFVLVLLLGAKRLSSFFHRRPGHAVMSLHFTTRTFRSFENTLRRLSCIRRIHSHS